MTLSEIKDQVAQEWDCDNWQDLEDYHKRVVGYPITEDMHDEVARRYAKAMIEADRADCAENGRVRAVEAIGVKEDGVTIQRIPYYFVDKDSILNRPYPEMK